MTVITTISKSEEAVIYAEMAKAVTRYAGTLTDDLYKLSVLRFISDRTFGFQKLSEEIPIRHFRNGVQSASKGITCAGLGMSEAKLYDCLRWWRAEGIIVTTKFRRKVRYAIKRERVLALVPPKKRDKIAPALTLMDDKWGTEEPREHLHAVEVSAAGYLHEVEVHLKNHSPSGGREKIKSARELAPDADLKVFSSSDRSGNVGATSPTVAAPCTPVPSPAPQGTKRRKCFEEVNGWHLFRHYEKAVRTTWPEVRMIEEPSGKSRGQWSRVGEKWDHPDISLPDFLVWCAENWKAVHRTMFRPVERQQAREDKKQAQTPWPIVSGWRRRMEFPEYPDFGFLFAYRVAFLREYDRRDSHRIRAGLTLRDELIRRYMRRGHLKVDAEREADEHIARNKRHLDLEERENNVREAVRRIRSREQDLDTRLALARARRMQPISPTQRLPAKPKVIVTAEIEDTVVVKLGPFTWVDDEEEPMAVEPARELCEA